MTLIFWAAFAYVLGSIPFGLVIAKSGCNIDPRQDGSRNTGATNVARLCGMKYGIATLACDVLKGLLPVGLRGLLGGVGHGAEPGALAAILGHVYSCFMGFKGGKAVATTVGAFLALSFWPALIAIVLCLAMVWLTGHVSMGSLTFALSLRGHAPVRQLRVRPRGPGGHGHALLASPENIRRLSARRRKPWLKKD